MAPLVTIVDDKGDTAPVTGDVPLTPIQRWFFEHRTVSPHHFNQSHFLALRPDVDHTVLRRAVSALLEHHDALRMRFRHDGGWSQENAPVSAVDILQVVRTDDVEQVADAVHASFSLAEGPLLKAVLFDGPDPKLLLVAHHLVVDGVSWRILLDDLETGYDHGDLGAKTTSFRDWSLRLNSYAEEGAFDTELPFWSRTNDTPIPVDHDRTGGGVDSVSVLLDAADTDALLRGAPTTYRTGVNDVLLAACAWALSQWTGAERVSVDLEGHGREELFDDVDLARTVGWFTTMFPVCLDVPTGGWRDVVKSVRRQMRAVPGNGLGYGALRYLTGRLPAGPQPQVSFNYLGQFDSGGTESGLYRETLTSIGREQDESAPPEHLIDVVGEVGDGRLAFSWYFRTDRHTRATIEGVVAKFAEALRGIAGECR